MFLAMWKKWIERYLNHLPLWICTVRLTEVSEVHRHAIE